MTSQEIGELIRKRRKLLKLTQVELSAMSGITSRTITACERGLANVSFVTLARLLHVLDLELVIIAKSAQH